MSSDLLSIAVNVAHGFFKDESEMSPWWWWDLTILRMLSGTGWLVTAKRSKLIFDNEIQKAVAP